MSNKLEKQKTCETCQHFKCGQRELNYWKDIGFCTNDSFRFTTTNGRIVGVYDSQNQVDIEVVKGNPSHNIETVSLIRNVMSSRYCLQVSSKFGCIFYEKIK